MRVLLLIDSLGRGGAERQLALLAESLPPPFEVRVCSLGNGPFADHMRSRGVQVDIFHRRHRFDPLPALDLLRVLRDWRPDVVHSWGWISTLIVGPPCRAMRIPLIDGSIQTGGRIKPVFPALKRCGRALSTLVVANTHAGLQAWGVGPAKGRVVYNGFDWTRLDFSRDPSSGERSHGHAGPFTVVMMGRMVPARDYRLVIAAARLLREQGVRCRFLLVGDGADRSHLTAEAADLAADGIVLFPPPGMEVLGHLAEAHVGVLMADPDWALEGLSNAIMEYMACGLPVVCGQGGGNPELVVDGVTGFLVKPGDPDALADRIAYLESHGEERIAMGEAGRRRIRDEFSIERMTDGFIRVYEEASGFGSEGDRTLSTGGRGATLWKATQRE